jgi:uncharacterized membrane protein
MSLFKKDVEDKKRPSEMLEEEKKEFKDDTASIEELHADVEKQLQEQGFIFDKKHFIYQDKHFTFPERMADNVAKFGGSWKFVIMFGVFILIWMCINIYFLATKPFDPYPFILLNLILSCLAALQAPIIMMSQNRQAEKERRQQEINIEKDIVDFKQDRLDLILDQKEWQLLIKIKSQLDSMDKRLSRIESQTGKKKILKNQKKE